MSEFTLNVKQDPNTKLCKVTVTINDKTESMENVDVSAIEDVSIKLQKKLLK